MTEPPSKPAWRKRLKQVLQIGIFSLCLWGIWRTIAGAEEKFAAADFSPSQLAPGWLLLAAAAYLLGMLPSCIFWYNTLRTMGQRPTWAQTLAAFYIGHLGKYVPGKALVVVIRTALIRGKQVQTAVAATSVFVETLTMMAVGAAVAATILAIQFRDQTLLLAIAVGLALCAGVPTLPPIFRRIVRLLQLKRAEPSIDEAVSKLDFRLMALGWLTIALGWILMGLSLWATLKAMPGSELGGTPQELLLATCCVALAMVAGFLSLIPGGMGVRELIMMRLLTPAVGEVLAIVSAVTLRLVWLFSELILAGILYVGRRLAAARKA